MFNIDENAEIEAEEDDGRESTIKKIVPVDSERKNAGNLSSPQNATKDQGQLDPEKTPDNDLPIITECPVEKDKDKLTCKKTRAHTRATECKKKLTFKKYQHTNVQLLATARQAWLLR